MNNIKVVLEDLDSVQSSPSVEYGDVCERDPLPL